MARLRKGGRLNDKAMSPDRLLLSVTRYRSTEFNVISLFSPAGRSAERMRGDEGVFAARSEPAVPLIRPFGPPSPRWGEEGASGSLRVSDNDGEIDRRLQQGLQLFGIGLAADGGKQGRAHAKAGIDEVFVDRLDLGLDVDEQLRGLLGD